MEFFNGNFDCNPADLSRLAPYASVRDPNVNIARTRDTEGVIHGIQTGTNWAARFTGWLHISHGGEYTFEATKGPADSVALTIGDIQLFSSGCHDKSEGVVTLVEGYHQVGVTFTDDGWQDEIVLSYRGPDTLGSLQVVPAGRFSRSNVLMEFFNGNFDCKVSNLSTLTPHTRINVPNVHIARSGQTEPKI